MIVTKIKNRLCSKTYISALLLGIITTIDLNTQFISSLFPEIYRPFLLMIWPVVMMTMREMTNSALDDNVSSTNSN